jgi:hypothetical protein
MTPPVGFVCAWCDRVRTSLGEWREAQLDEPEYPLATHGICPECLARETRAALTVGAPLSLSLDEGR